MVGKRGTSSVLLPVGWLMNNYIIFRFFLEIHQFLEGLEFDFFHKKDSVLNQRLRMVFEALQTKTEALDSTIDGGAKRFNGGLVGLINLDALPTATVGNDRSRW